MDFLHDHPTKKDKPNDKNLPHSTRFLLLMFFHFQFTMPALQAIRQHYLTSEEKIMVVNTYHVFEERKRVKTLIITGRLREAVAEALGFAPRTTSSAMQRSRASRGEDGEEEKKVQKEVRRAASTIDSCYVLCVFVCVCMCELCILKSCSHFSQRPRYRVCHDRARTSRSRRQLHLHVNVC